jgi:hypothetical protein
VLVYAYAIGERSSRRIERRCIEDVADVLPSRVDGSGRWD